MNFDIPKPKITRYLLANPTKSGFFLRFGYSVQEWSQLRDDIENMARNFPMIFERETEYGKKYVVRGEIKTLFGRTIKITSVWMAEPSDPAILRFLTAYPT